MTIKKSGKCDVCRKVVIEYKTFQTNVDMFEPDAKPALRGEFADQVRAWRDRLVHCEDHLNNSVKGIR